MTTKAGKKSKAIKKSIPFRFKINLMHQITSTVQTIKLMLKNWSKRMQKLSLIFTVDSKWNLEESSLLIG